MNFYQALQLALIVLKLMGYITWSWWLVLLPAIILFAVCFIEALRDVRREQRTQALFKPKSDK